MGQAETEPTRTGRPAGVVVAAGDLCGDLHVHSTGSDGANTIAEIADAAEDLGYEYIAICDHSSMSSIANGRDAADLLDQIEMIRELNESGFGVTILGGTECDIWPDGTLDYADEVLAACDIVVASVHWDMDQDRRSATRRLCRAMENPYVTVLGHPTGRLVGLRPPVDLDMDAIIGTAVATGTALEVNAAPGHRDLDEADAARAVEAGALLAINSDAHAVDQLGRVRAGVEMARRVGVPRDSVINTRSPAALRALVAAKRGA
jgi:DNA polymerase (family 10)